MPREIISIQFFTTTLPLFPATPPPQHFQVYLYNLLSPEFQFSSEFAPIFPVLTTNISDSEILIYLTWTYKNL